MTPNFGEGGKVIWSELFPYELKRKLGECPIVYLPMGLCEPHGQISAFGLDTIKAEWLCQMAARRVGGVVAPPQGYHIHETGYHARVAGRGCWRGKSTYDGDAARCGSALLSARSRASQYKFAMETI